MPYCGVQELPDPELQGRVTPYILEWQLHYLLNTQSRVDSGLTTVMKCVNCDNILSDIMLNGILPTELFNRYVCVGIHVWGRICVLCLR